MALSVEEKEGVFDSELKRIFDPKIREFTRLCIVAAPDYALKDCPSSTSGKHHPVDELGADGNVIHSKKIFTLGYELSRALGVEYNRDLILSACLIHDLRKQGINRTGHTQKSHPDLAAKLVEEVQAATQLLTEEQYQMIRNCVGLHYGLWSERAWTKPITQYTMEELCVYLSDYVVSKRFITTDYRRADL